MVFFVFNFIPFSPLEGFKVITIISNMFKCHFYLYFQMKLSLTKLSDNLEHQISHADMYSKQANGEG